ncbi:hypothetical protein GJ496_007572 [Pomphorhynchus laevis]|nr:hypothetical protein GJ496_007572 [Pomphorhynchus laevis]
MLHVQGSKARELPLCIVIRHPQNVGYEMWKSLAIGKSVKKEMQNNYFQVKIRSKQSGPYGYNKESDFCDSQVPEESTHRFKYTYSPSSVNNRLYALEPLAIAQNIIRYKHEPTGNVPSGRTHIGSALSNKSSVSLYWIKRPSPTLRCQRTKSASHKCDYTDNNTRSVCNTFNRGRQDTVMSNCKPLYRETIIRREVKYLLK